MSAGRRSPLPLGEAARSAGEGSWRQRLMDFKWDPEKARQNLVNHGVSFEKAATAFDDPFVMIFPDELHSDDEDRGSIIGRSATLQVLTVVYTLRGETVRLISARPAQPRESRRYYEEGE